MKNTIESLFLLQQLELQRPPIQQQHGQAEALRANIPPNCLRTFDGFIARGKKGVATVRNRVCGECHLQLTVSTLGGLISGHNLQQCGNCSRFLYLPEGESIFPPAKAVKTKSPRKRKAPLTI